MSGNFNPYDHLPHSHPSQPVQHPLYGDYPPPGQPAPQHFHYGIPQDPAQGGAPPAVLPQEYDPHLSQHVDPTAAFAEAQQAANVDVARWIEREADASPVDPKAGGKARRKAAGGEHVKHRRTRSGCFTCRQRRVKCDETHPICERCRKGQRECIYPDASSKNTSGTGPKGGARRKPSMESLSEEDEFEDEEDADSPRGVAGERLQTSAVGKTSTRKASRSALNLVRTGSSSVEHKLDDSLSPSTEVSALNSGKLSHVSTNTSHDDSPVSPFPKDHHMLLDYHKRCITFHHYQFKYDNLDFVHTVLLDYASHYDPLLYAILGFAAFHYTINNSTGKVSDFLGFYTRSVSLFRKSLQTSQHHTIAMLLTVLQLATFEEYLGDWVNLFGHQRAAAEMLTEIYEPVSVAQDRNSRMILVWYSRFDLFVGMMSGNEPTLGSEWFRYNAEWYAQAVRENPGSLELKVENYFAVHRLLAVEMAILNAKLPRGEILVEDYIREISQLRERINGARPLIDELSQIEEYQIHSMDEMRPRSPEDIAEPYIPGRLMKGVLFPLNVMRLDWSAMNALSMYQTAIVLGQPPPFGDMFRFAMEQIRVFEDIDNWLGSDSGAIVPLQASLGLVCLFVPREQRYTMWCRRKLAKVECHGYVYPASLRTKLAEDWGEPSVERWWLPDESTCPPMIRNIRNFIEERTMKPRSQVGEDIRAMKAMFSKFSIDDSTSNSPDSIANTAEHSGASSSAGGLHKLGSPSSDGVRDDYSLRETTISSDMRNTPFNSKPSG